MAHVKRTFSIPRETVEAFEMLVPSRRRSAVIASLLQEWMEEQHRQQLRAAIIEGLIEMGDIYLEVAKEWESADDALMRALDD